MFVEHKEQGEVKEMDEAGKLLLKAANYLEKYGLCKGALWGANESRCAIGALDEVGPLDSAHYEARRRLRTAADCSCIPEWNDREETTLDTVVSTMRVAALGL